MELTLTRRGEYVVRAAVELARRFEGGGWHKADAIAEATRVPPGYVRQILRVLVMGGIAEARAGNAGGYRLHDDPSKISILDLVETGEGMLVNSRCVMRGSGCDRTHPCMLHEVFSQAHERLRMQLASTSLRTVVARKRR